MSIKLSALRLLKIKFRTKTWLKGLFLLTMLHFIGLAFMYRNNQIRVEISFYKSLSDILDNNFNYFKGFKRDKLFEKELCHVPS